VPTVAWQKAGERVTYALDGGVYAASSAVNWAREIGLFAGWDEISGFAENSATARGLAFVPALAGLACPHWNRAARGAWLGLALDTGRREMMQALIEGIAFRMAEVMDELSRAVPINAPVSIDGGMSVNGWFCQFLADATGLEIAVAENPELTALGTAMLAAEGAGGTVAAARPARTLSPRPLPRAARETFARARAAVEGFAAA
jgi:glycerol kinase